MHNWNEGVRLHKKSTSKKTGISTFTYMPFIEMEGDPEHRLNVIFVSTADGVDLLTIVELKDDVHQLTWKPHRLPLVLEHLAKFTGKRLILPELPQDSSCLGD